VIIAFCFGFIVEIDSEYLVKDLSLVSTFSWNSFEKKIVVEQIITQGKIPIGSKYQVTK
jgi:hypothetical protein